VRAEAAGAIFARQTVGAALAAARGRGQAPPLREEVSASSELEVLLRPDPTLHDGRFANNGWLQELPRPLTKLTWDNAVLVSPRLAEENGLRNGDVVSVSAGGRSVRGPVWIDPGSPAGTATIHFGQGRRRAGRVGSGTGFDAYPLRTSGALWSVPGATLEKTALRSPLACTQGHFTMENRDLIRMQTLAGPAGGDQPATEGRPPEARQRRLSAGANPLPYEGGGEKPGAEASPPPSFYPEHRYDGYRWGMAIDLSACVGCNACMVACQAENNVPVVGKDQVLRGREMHWLRVDRYFTGDLDSPESAFQPVPCMQCEKAPCEPVCPVAATVHSSEGLNDMVYNRCIGTRYCSNNCPYKVRRFNFFNYAKEYGKTTLLPLLANPDVTVRFRGVMEKCTYCVQRINAARIGAEKEGRRIRDGEIVTACQQACAARAIVFGDLNDPKSEVVRWKADRRNYALLAELGTNPRTTYLAVVRNPNPELAGGAA
jgi:molybdopterin-containing oxidoreductase family iron-sulfur binding subunit